MFGEQNYNFAITNAFQNIQNSLTALSNRISTISNSLIPKNNLPIYLQNYTFSSQGGVLTPYFNIVGGLSTNLTYHRTWNVVMAGSLSNSPSQIIFTYDFSGVVSTYSVTIDGTIAGTFTIDGQVYDASQYFGAPVYVRKILTLTLDLSGIPQNTNGGDFYFNLFIADDASNSCSCDKCKCDNPNAVCNDCVNYFVNTKCGGNISNCELSYNDLYQYAYCSKGTCIADVNMAE